MTLADEDANSTLTDDANMTIQGGTQWTNLKQMQVTPKLQLKQLQSSGGQIFNLCKLRHLVAKFETDASGAKYATYSSGSGANWW